MSTTLLDEPVRLADAQCRCDDVVHVLPPAQVERKPQKDAREGAARARCAPRSGTPRAPDGAGAWWGRRH